MDNFFDNVKDILNLQRKEIEDLQKEVKELKKAAEIVNPIRARLEYINMQVAVTNSIMQYLSPEQQSIVLNNYMTEIFNEDIADEINKYDFVAALNPSAETADDAEYPEPVFVDDETTDAKPVEAMTVDDTEDYKPLITDNKKDLN